MGETENLSLIYIQKNVYFSWKTEIYFSHFYNKV